MPAVAVHAEDEKPDDQGELRNARGDGDDDVDDLANAMLLTRSNSTRLVDMIEAAGLVARVRTPADRRGAMATLTPVGLRALRLAWPVYARGIREHFLAYLDRAELTVLRNSLNRVHEGAENSRKPGRRRRRAQSKA